MSLSVFQSFFNKQYLKVIDRSNFIGILGAIGKTTTALSLKSILSQKIEVFLTERPLNYQDLLKLILNSKNKKIICEIDHGLNLGTNLDLKINTLIFTHGFFDEPSYKEPVTKLLESIPEGGLIIFNGDDITSKKYLEKTSAQIVFYGMSSEYHVWANNLRVNNFQTTFQLNCGVERVQITTKLLGYQHIYSLLAAATLAIELGFSLVNIKKGLENLEPLEHTFEPLNGANNSIVIDDTSNGEILATLEALEALNYISARRRYLVLGELETDEGNHQKVYQEVARKIYKDKIDQVFLGGGDAKIIADELLKLGFIAEKVESNLSHSQLVSALLRVLSKGDVVLVKAKSQTRFDEVVKRITKKN